MADSDDILITPWVGPGSCKRVLTVMVLSTNTSIIEAICKALLEVHAKKCYNWQLILLRSMTISSVMKEVQITGAVGIDFVVVALDTSKTNCIEWASTVLKQVHPDLIRRRVVLVNASGLPSCAMAVSLRCISDLKQDYFLELFNANVFKQEESHHLARRLFTFLEVSLGTKTGIPNLNV